MGISQKLRQRIKSTLSDKSQNNSNFYETLVYNLPNSENVTLHSQILKRYQMWCNNTQQIFQDAIHLEINKYLQTQEQHLADLENKISITESDIQSLNKLLALICRTEQELKDLDKRLI